MAKVSIIIPCCKQAKYLPETFAFTQTYKDCDWNIKVCDIKELD